MQTRDFLRNRNFGLKSIIRLAILSVSICVFIASVFMLGRKLYGYYNDNKKFEQLRSQTDSADLSANFASNDISTSSEAVIIEQDDVLPYSIVCGNTAELDENSIFTKYSTLKEQNSDLVGWIQMPGFKNPIDYPVLQTDNNDFYLHNDFNKNSSKAGSIFMDFRNNPQDIDRHIILYGHAMNNRSMFGNLKDFPMHPENHTTKTKIYLDLMNTRMEYEVFSIYFEDSRYNYRQTSFADDSEYAAFLDRIRSKSVYDYKVKLTAKDKIITLSTCDNKPEGDMRSVTHARLRRQIVYSDRS